MGSHTNATDSEYSRLPQYAYLLAALSTQTPDLSNLPLESPPAEAQCQVSLSFICCCLPPSGCLLFYLLCLWLFISSCLSGAAYLCGCLHVGLLLSVCLCVSLAHRLTRLAVSLSHPQARCLTVSLAVSRSLSHRLTLVVLLSHCLAAGVRSGAV